MGGRDVRLLNLPEVALSPIERLFLLPGRAALLLKQRAIPAFHLHQLVNHGAKLTFMCLSIQTLGDLRDARLQPFFRGLEMFHLAPSPGGDGPTFFLRENPPPLKQL